MSSPILILRRSRIHSKYWVYFAAFLLYLLIGLVFLSEDPYCQIGSINIWPLWTINCNNFWTRQMDYAKKEIIRMICVCCIYNDDQFSLTSYKVDIFAFYLFKEIFYGPFTVLPWTVFIFTAVMLQDNAHLLEMNKKYFIMFNSCKNCVHGLRHLWQLSIQDSILGYVIGHLLPILHNHYHWLKLAHCS